MRGMRWRWRRFWRGGWRFWGYRRSLSGCWRGRRGGSLRRWGMWWRRMRRRGGWRGKRWGGYQSSVISNQLSEREWRRDFGSRRFLLLGNENGFNAEDAEGAEKR